MQLPPGWRWEGSVPPLALVTFAHCGKDSSGAQLIARGHW